MRKFILLCLALLIAVLPAACSKEETAAPENTAEIKNEDVEAFLRGENKALLEAFDGQE